MTATLDKDDRAHLRELAPLLQQPGVKKTMLMLRDAGGEVPFRPDGFKNPQSIVMLNGLITSGLLVAERESELLLSPRTFLRLTDLGRRVLDYYEKMNANAVTVDHGIVDTIPLPD
jgi:hypothetical protein